MIELVKTKKEYLGNVILPINTKLKVENNKIVFECSSYLRPRINIEFINDRINFLLLGYNNSEKVVERQSAEEDYELWGIYVMEEKRIPINNCAEGFAELVKEFPFETIG